MTTPRENPIVNEPATPEACQRDYGSDAERDQREAAAEANRVLLPLRVNH